MTLLAVPRARAPLVVCDVFYAAGSVDEPPGRSGVAHFLEHLLFKGTKRFPKGQLDRLTVLAGGEANAETGEDDTHYWFSLPRMHWEMALELEADRMRGALLEASEIERERRVITEERARDLDSPLGRLDQQHQALSYLVHPYRNPILGWPDDLAAIDRDDLERFYKRHYRPDGAVLVVVGDLEPELVLDRAEAMFSGIPRGRGEGPQPPPAEPPQTGRRSFSLEEAESVPRGLLGWHTVALRHPDAPALGVAAELLAGGRRSRLWNHLVETARLAAWVDAEPHSAHWAGQFFVHVEGAQGVEPERLEAEVLGQLEQLAADGPTEAELERHRRRLEASWRWEQAELQEIAAGLGQAALWSHWTSWGEDYRAAMAVRPHDIQRVVSHYLVEGGLTAGWLVARPTNAWSLPEVRRAQTPAVADRRREPVPSLGLIDAPAASLSTPSYTLGRSSAGSGRILPGFRPRRSRLENGLKILCDPIVGSGVVSLALRVDSGQLRELKPGAAQLTGRMLEEGTKTRTADELARAIEDVGGTLDVGPGGVSLHVRAEDLALAVELMADVVMRPAFPADAFSWAKRRIATELMADRDDPVFRADALLRSLVYEDHPYGRDPRGNTRTLAALRPEHVREHHSRFFRPDGAVLVAAGDVELARLEELVAAHLKAWRPRGKPLPVPARPIRSPRARHRRVNHPGEQVHLLFGHLGVNRLHPDFDALCVLDQILGAGPGVTDRLSAKIRDELGLAYAVSGGMTDSADLLEGMFRIYVGTGPDLADQASAAVLELVHAIHLGRFGDDEVEQARGFLVGSWAFDYQTVSQRCDRLLEHEHFGLPLDEARRWPRRIERVTPRDVRRVARAHLHPEALSRVEYGPLPARGKRANDCA